MTEKRSWDLKILGYGRIIVGDNNTIRAEFDVDYIIYNDSPNM